MTDVTDPRLRCRLWVDGHLEDEAWVDSTAPDVAGLADIIRDRHSEITDLADLDGRPWLIEVYDPAKPDERAYLRFGTDPAGMVDPQQVDDLGESITDDAPGTERVQIQDVLCLAVPPEVEDRPMTSLYQVMNGLAVQCVRAQYAGRAVPKLVIQGIDWLITSDPSKVDEFQPAHDCAACRAGNDRALAFLRDNPNRMIAMANIAYTEVWPAAG